MTVRLSGDVPVARVVLLVVVGSATPVAVVASGVDGVTPPVWLLVVAVALGLGQAVLPDSGFGTAGGLLVLGWWGVGAPADLLVLSDGVLLAAAALVTGHAASVLASYGPDDVPLDRGLTLLWTARACLLMVAALLAWTLAMAVEGVRAPPGVWAAGVVAVLAALVAGQVAMPRLEDLDD